MPSNFTEHFKLNQWEKTDKILMEDFNADNAKIDDAIFNYRAGELIADVTVEEETGDLYLDISQVDWSRYLAVVLRIHTSTPDGFEVSLNSENEICAYAYMLAHAIYGDNHFMRFQDSSSMVMVLPVFYSGEYPPLSIAFSGNADTIADSRRASLGSGNGKKPLNQCGPIHIRRDQYYSGTTFSPGDRMVLWGIK